MRAVLERAVAEAEGGARIERVERVASPYRTSFALEDVVVRLDDGRTMDLIFKDVSKGSLSGSAKGAKPAFLHDPLREIETYRQILDPAALGTARVYAAEVDPDHGRYWLFLEKVAGVELYQVGERSTWERVAGWLGRMHVVLEAFSGRADDAHLLRYDDAFYRGWLERARTFHPSVATLKRLERTYDTVVDRLVSLPTSVIHGEFYASNVLVETDGPAFRVCPVDWEMAAVGPALIDLAALGAGRWSQDERTAFARAYVVSAALNEDLETTLAALDFCRLHLSVQWLGWSADWEPPPEHAHDWLGEATGLVEKLGL